jgi:predicted phosphate transport protein (TIGR00153 family)
MIIGKLLPRGRRFYALFDEHGSRIGAGAHAFLALVENYGDAALREKHAGEVDAAERSADRVTAEVVRLLHQTLITPIDRGQILGLINAMDDVLDLIQDATETLSLYDVRAIRPEVVQLANISVRCCERVQHAVTLLPRLSEAAVAQAAIKTCDEIDRLESDADRVMRAAMSQLFREESDVRELIKLKAIYELLESITDRCEDVANLVEGIVLKNR